MPTDQCPLIIGHWILDIDHLTFGLAIRHCRRQTTASCGRTKEKSVSRGSSSRLKHCRITAINTSPRPLIAVALAAHAPGSPSPRSIMRPPVHTNACCSPDGVSAVPATSPASFIAVTSVYPPPSEPRLRTVPLVHVNATPLPSPAITPLALIARAYAGLPAKTARARITPPRHTKGRGTSAESSAQTTTSPASLMASD